MISNVISKMWLDLINLIIANPSKFSSEKTMVFQFAWMLKVKFGNEIDIDFERQLYHNFSDGEFLDLFFELEGQKVGVEFKFPKNNSKYSIVSKTRNTNQTQTRVKILNHIKRLSYLVNHDIIDYGFFLLATNETPYINQGNKIISNEFKTYSDTIYYKDKVFPIHLKNSKEDVVCPQEICFKWNGYGKDKILNTIAWIEPIVLFKT